MIEYTEYFHYGTIALVVALNSISVGIGEGLTSLAALKALHIQPSARSEISRTFILGVALIETAAVIGLTVSLLLFSPVTHANHTPIYAHYAELGIALAICLSGAVIGIASSFPAQEACYAIARQPFFSQKIQSLMLLTQSLMQTPLIFAFIVALFIRNQMHDITTVVDSLRLIASGLCIGVGSIGPSIGLAFFSHEVCKSIGINKKAYPQLLSFTLVSEALIESPLIFALLISLMLVSIKTTSTTLLIDGLIFLSAGLCMGIGTFGPGISSGRVAASACRSIALYPERYNALLKTSLFGQVLIETSAIYALIISLFLILSR